MPTTDGAGREVGTRRGYLEGVRVVEVARVRGGEVARRGAWGRAHKWRDRCVRACAHTHAAPHAHPHPHACPSTCKCNLLG